MSFPQTIPTNDNGYAWYQCSCCPYGYHIDLDFVRYCESIGQVERSGSIKRRKDRRRQRQSMEVLLGLTSPIIVAQKEPPLPPIRDAARSPHIQDALNDVVSDFERTLQRSKNKLSNNLPDVTAVSGDGPGGRDFDTVSIESCGLSPTALQSIREQMALSLERTKELEEMVKIVPSLQAQVSALKDENRKLLNQIQLEEEAKLNRINSNYLVQYNSRSRSQSFSNDDTIDHECKQLPPPPPPRRDFGVMAAVLTRNIGVGYQAPHTKTVSTTTQFNNYLVDNNHVDRWFEEKNKFLNGPNCNINKLTVDKQTQAVITKEIREISLQTNLIPPKPVVIEATTQTTTAKKVFNNVGTNTLIKVASVQTQYSPEVVSVGVSDHTTEPISCKKCTCMKRTLGVGTTDPLKESQIPQPISLAALSMPRSKSFHLGEGKLNHQHKRTVGSQYELFTSNKSSQIEIKTSTKWIQYENNGFSKSTDTSGLGPTMKHKSCECIEVKAKTVEVGCNTSKEAPVVAHVEPEEVSKKEETPSRIPRPQIPTTPVENRKFRRQDTYTKIPAAEKSPTGLSALELVSSKALTPESTSPFEKVKQKYKLPDVPNATNGSPGSSPEEIKQLPKVSESALCQPPSPRKKCSPSKEMQGAMKVLNDSLQKNHGRDLKGHSTNAHAIVEAEWFKVSSTVNADPVDVEDYLDCFEDISSILLEYVVNMVDTSGNTAMHYAVSHGNFDVVSILLDSKVCDINKQNKAGYTSVMLVSLAEVRSQTHANVVRRLFSLADVNIRAKQHGQTALMLAVSHGRLDMVSMLLEAGADINIQDEDGSTALMCAAEHGHVDIVKHFLSQPDCDSSISDVDGSTALKIAMEAGHRHIGVLLYAHERNLHGAALARPKKSKSTSASPKTPSSPLMQRSVNRALPANNK